MGQDQVKVLPTEKTPYFQQRKEVLWREHLLAKGGFVRKGASVPHYANVTRLGKRLDIGQMEAQQMRVG